MSRIHNQYRELESSYNYIDKTECLEKEIERFPSVYIMVSMHRMLSFLFFLYFLQHGFSTRYKQKQLMHLPL